MISKEWDLAIQLVAISVLAYQALRYKFLLITAIESNRGRESLCENYKSLIDSMLAPWSTVYQLRCTLTRDDNSNTEALRCAFASLRNGAIYLYGSPGGERLTRLRSSISVRLASQ